MSSNIPVPMEFCDNCKRMQHETAVNIEEISELTDKIDELRKLKEHNEDNQANTIDDQAAEIERLKDESFLSYIQEQKEWSIKTFGVGLRTIGISKHILCELNEIDEKPEDLEEWIDVIQLAIDGAWRIGYTAQEVFECLKSKLKINQNREWDVQEGESKPNFHKH